MDKFQEQISFRPKARSGYIYQLVEDKEISQSRGVPGSESRMSITNTIDLRCQWGQREQDASYPAMIVLEGIGSKSDSGPGFFKTVDEGLTEIEKAATVFKGSVFRLVTAKNGKVNSIEGYQEAKRKFDNTYKRGNSPDSALLSPQAYFVGVFEKLFMVLPDTSVTIGSTWMRDEAPLIGEPVHCKTKYTVMDIKSDTVIIELKSIVEYYDRTQQHSTLVEGSGNGLLELNKESGLLLRGSSSIETAWNMENGPIQVTTRIKYTTKIKGMPIQ